MKLYQYDHCPFCVRAEMVANYKNIGQTNVYVANDDSDTCIKLIGAKMVPILEQNGEAMGESLDIAKRFDEIGDAEKVIRAGGNAQPYLTCLSTVDLAINCLLFPRNIKIGLPEFSSQSAQDYFQANKEKMIARSFSTAMSETEEHKVAVEVALSKLPTLVLPSEKTNSISWDDVLIYPTLRNLTMVKDLVFPVQVKKYLDEISALTATHTYFDKAI